LRRGWDDIRHRQDGALGPYIQVQRVGDGGACFTNDDGLADLLKSIRNHGQGADRYENVRIGMNARLDTIQAAILIEKLKIFPEEIELREKVVRRYNAGLSKSNRPELVATAEIKTGKRSIASYILNPILRTADEGMREP